MSTCKSNSRQAAANSPVPWFVALVAARAQGNHRLCDRATSQLERLGVRVSFSHPVKAREDGQ